MPITIPDDPRLEARAKAEGFADAAAYLRHLVEREIEAEPNGRRVLSDRTSDRQSPFADPHAWIEAFKADLESLPAGGGDWFVDDSRESIYPVR